MLSQFLLEIIAAIAQAIAAQAVPAIVAGLQKPSTAEQSAPPAAERSDVLAAIQSALQKGEVP